VALTNDILGMMDTIPIPNGPIRGKVLFCHLAAFSIQKVNAFIVPFRVPLDLDITCIRSTSLILHRHGFSIASGDVGVDLY